MLSLQVVLKRMENLNAFAGLEVQCHVAQALHGLQVGSAEIVGRVVEDLKDESEPYRRMVMETIDKVVKDLGSADLDARLEELLIDGILYAFQEQVCTVLLSASSNLMLGPSPTLRSWYQTKGNCVYMLCFL